MNLTSKTTLLCGLLILNSFPIMADDDDSEESVIQTIPSEEELRRLAEEDNDNDTEEPVIQRIPTEDELRRIANEENPGTTTTTDTSGQYGALPLKQPQSETTLSGQETENEYGELRLREINQYSDFKDDNYQQFDDQTSKVLAERSDRDIFEENLGLSSNDEATDITFANVVSRFIDYVSNYTPETANQELEQFFSAVGINIDIASMKENFTSVDLGEYQTAFSEGPPTGDYAMEIRNNFYEYNEGFAKGGNTPDNESDQDNGDDTTDIEELQDNQER